MKRINYAKLLAVAAFLTPLPNLLRADCIPSGATGDVVPFTLVTLKNTQVTGYATGSLTISNSSSSISVDHSTTLSGKQIPQLFSDRLTCVGGGPCLSPDQPFDFSTPDHLGVSITEATTLTIGSGFSTSINVTLTLESWGNGKINFIGSCNNTGELHGTFDSNTSALIAFGTPTSVPPPPK
jgi:hypothetical protein